MPDTCDEPCPQFDCDGSGCGELRGHKLRAAKGAPAGAAATKGHICRNVIHGGPAKGLYY